MAKKRSREALVPELTPLIDVVFLLLIFFMVSTVFKTDELALLLNLPKVEKGLTSEKSQTKAQFIELTTNGIAINGKKLGDSELDTNLKGISNKETPMELRIDKEVKYDRVMMVLSKLKKYELTNLALITEE
ncbi:MAG: biopolymer transporter ExbD [Bacteriovoracaceae bacterium]|nr:biopolymer transporter ExbD [Bacteriovoracaceae bacterium]